MRQTRPAIARQYEIYFFARRPSMSDQYSVIFSSYLSDEYARLGAMELILGSNPGFYCVVMFTVRSTNRPRTVYVWPFYDNEEETLRRLKQPIHDALDGRLRGRVARIF